ncbi:hypothetical protein [Streptomyces sp.]|uniref:hypothetical protein n=1 Tax=Streptomyces sp. TaxID=1931 RepID=UPI002F3F28C7
MTTVPGPESPLGADSVTETGREDPPVAAEAVLSSPRPAPTAGLVFDDPLDRPSADDSDRGWGEGLSGVGTMDDDFARFLNEKPPHHL